MNDTSHPPAPLPVIQVVAAAIVRDGRVLAARRGPASRSQVGLWELPGGKVEAGEGERAALAREIAEELHLDVEVGAFVSESVHAYPDKRVRLVAYACEAAGEPRATEHDALRWLSADELDDVTWAPADLPLLPAVRRLLAP